MASSNKTNSNQRIGRLTVKSAIPNMELDLKSLPQRPNPTISSNQFQQLETNHFQCTLNNNIVLYQYDIVVEQFNLRDEQWIEIGGRAKSAMVLNNLLANNLLENQQLVWHDERKCLYSFEKLETPKIVTNSNIKERIHIRTLTNQWSTKELDDYINGRAVKYPHDIVRCIETLLKRSLGNRINIVGNTFYPNENTAKSVEGGFIERPGFFQALNLSNNKITLNLQTKLSTFYPEMMLLDFIEIQIGARGIPNENQIKRLNSLLKDCLLVTKQSNWKQVYEFSRFDRRLPSQIKLETGINLVEYYQTKNITLEYSNYPCIEVYRLENFDEPCYLPMELCRIQGWQIFDKQIPKSINSNQSRSEIPKPHIRYKMILDTIRFCNYNSDTNRLCNTIGLKVSSTMLKVSASVLKQPNIENGENHRVQVKIGRIPLNGYLFDPQPLKTLSITYFGENYNNVKNHVEDFVKYLITVLRRHHIDLRYTFEQCRSHQISIEQHIRQLKEKKCEFLICIMNSRHENQLTEINNNIKHCATVQYGIMTQCINWPKVSRMRSVQSYCDNIVRKINMKNDGINTRLIIDPSLKKQINPSDNLMFFGADVIHPTNVTKNHPSIATLVGSGDSLCSTTAARVCRQFPREGKCTIETILGLTEMMEELLEYYQYSNDDELPNKIIFYRDGVDDGQFGKLLAHEIPLIREAFKNLYGDSSKHPKLTFIVVKKRHNTRFFDTSRNSIENMNIGVAIDTSIVHPYQYNFYLNSHNAFQGVNRPSLYHVILDENNFTANEIALLSYHQCFTDPRSSASEAIPSVVHLADIAANKARNIFYNDDSSSIGGQNRRSQPISNPKLEDLSYEILRIHEEIEDFPALS